MTQRRAAVTPLPASPDKPLSNRELLALYTRYTQHQAELRNAFASNGELVGVQLVAEGKDGRVHHVLLPIADAGRRRAVAALATFCGYRVPVPVENICPTASNHPIQLGYEPGACFPATARNHPIQFGYELVKHLPNPDPE